MTFPNPVDRGHLEAKWEGKDVPPLQRQEPDQDSLF